MGKKDYQNDMASIPVAICVGAGVSLGTTLIGTVVVAILLLNETIGETAIGYSVLVLTLISAMIGSTVSLLISKRKMFVVSVSTSVIFAFMLMSLTAMFFDGQYSGTLVTVIVILGGGISSVLIAGKTILKQKTTYKKLKL